MTKSGGSVFSEIPTLELYQEKINEAIKKSLLELGPSLKEEGGSVLRDACEYALLNGGKRFRPALVYMVGEALANGCDVSAAALAIEYFHTASLIADDLPCMDDDDERRNKPTVHKVYGEATALLASYVLIASGYGFIAKAAEEYRSKEAVIALANAAKNTGILGAAGGQFLDIAPPNLKLKTLREIIEKKTVSLFEISFVFGWLFGGGDVGLLPDVKKCASHFGFAFQIADDLDDVEQDRRNGRFVNVASVFGIPAAQKMFHEEIEGYCQQLHQLGIPSEELLSLARVLKQTINLTK